MSGGFSLRQRIRYRFDNTLSRGLWAVLLWLGAVAALFFLLMAFIISLSGIGPNDEGTSFGDGLWLSLTRSLDPGTFSGDDGSRFRIIMLFVTLAGIFIAATIIGLVSSAIDSRVESAAASRWSSSPATRSSSDGATSCRRSCPSSSRPTSASADGRSWSSPPRTPSR